MVTFTAEEQKWIDHCFDSTLAHFMKNPLDRDNVDHIRQAINHRNYNIGQIGVKGHTHMHSIFEKLGYCSDGKTTKDEAMQREITLEKEKARVWHDQKSKMLADIDAKIQELTQLKRNVMSHDETFNEVVKEKAVVAQQEFKAQMKDERKESQAHLLTETAQILTDMTLRELREIAREKKIVNYSRMRKADLVQQLIGGTN